MQKRLLISYLYCNLGGVVTVIKQRLPHLLRDGWVVDCVFKQDNGGAQDLLDAGVNDLRILGNDLQAEVARRCPEYDLVTIFDDPDVLSAAVASAPNVIYEIHTPIDSVLDKNDPDDLGQCAKIIVPSQWSKSWIARRFPELDAEQILVCPNIVAEDSQEDVATVAFEERELLWVGKLAPYKNWKEALRIASLLLADETISRLTFVTGGNLTNQLSVDLMTEMAHLGITDRVRWLHGVPYVALLEAYRAAADKGGALLSCSLAESFCYVIHEAIRAGLPVIATDVGAVRDVIEDGRTGQLYDLGDYEQARQKVARLMSDDPARAAICGASMDLLTSRYGSTMLAAGYTEALNALHAVEAASI